MARISRQQVDRIAELARLSLEGEEAEAMERDLERILDYVADLQALDTEGVTPTAHAIALATPVRPDEAAAPMDPELVVSNAPESSGTAFVVPKVVEEEGS
ncbi:MAG: Asp-tRNA(Asn)/Glu-tRNA(Gln) amidotransferase subunit GatC [Myxococcota bacterium]|nr:Asp-tRNA(Asn)/Glu-tRNA(Gln) amidotransferase subunit GatC [Myxococcota bacterium]